MRLAMIFFAVLCIAIGVARTVVSVLAISRAVRALHAAHVVTQLQLLLFSGLAFFVMLPYLQRTLTITLDTDWIWRRLLPGTATLIERLIKALQATIAPTRLGVRRCQGSPVVSTA